jgi:amino acid transporter
VSEVFALCVFIAAGVVFWWFAHSFGEWFLPAALRMGNKQHRGVILGTLGAMVVGFLLAASFGWIPKPAELARSYPRRPEDRDVHVVSTGEFVNVCLSIVAVVAALVFLLSAAFAIGRIALARGDRRVAVNDFRRCGWSLLVLVVCVICVRVFFHK